MKTLNSPIGPASLCLLLLAGCASAPPSPEPQVIVSGCPVVVPCSLPAAKPAGNGELLRDVEVVEAAWAECAAQVDTVYQAQQETPQP
ncbi:Rz1-like lysis system protein LysC [Pseudomonas arcuscaelestis]|uniref:Rz1-like lysis system protein LysC n=1 Tax=Pseudomonas arcuscaelestis TaxID=2710591 RepID=UPI0039A6AC9E